MYRLNLDKINLKLSKYIDKINFKLSKYIGKNNIKKCIIYSIMINSKK